VCAVCEYEEVKPIPVVAHTPSEWTTVTPAGHTTEGSEHKVCIVCDYEIETRSIPATGHTFGEAWLSSSAGHWHKCTEDEETSTVVAHTASLWIIDTAATTSAAGNKHKECTVCQRSLETASIPKLTIAVTGVTLDKSTANITVGSTTTLKATVAPANATNKAVTWKSSDIAIATVDTNGTVTAKKAGTAKITVTTTDGGKTATATITVTSAVQKEPEKIAMYRLYNKNNGEHFYTANVEERDKLIALTWKYEGISWYAPATGDPVYRLYNKYSGEHHYTKKVAERDKLVSLGWKYERIGWYADKEQGVEVFRLYNKNAKGQFEAGAHHYTTKVEERDKLVALGWKYEGIGWHGMK
jgi:hypothetical protein